MMEICASPPPLALRRCHSRSRGRQSRSSSSDRRHRTTMIRRGESEHKHWLRGVEQVGVGKAFGKDA
eukprot:5756058-Pleurochrysis_carterae.AAC.1